MLPTTDDIAQLYRLAPYLPLDLQGWHYDQPIFEQVIAELKPRLIIEVGSWKGASAVHMAKLLQKYCDHPGRESSAIFCIDYFNTMQIDGHQGSFDIFLSNIRQLDLEHYIIPIRGQSVAVSKSLEGFKADLIYIDADHTEESCYNDLVAYWPLLRPGGVLLGDDYHEIPSVKTAVTRFCSERGLTAIDVADGYHYRINK